MSEKAKNRIISGLEDARQFAAGEAPASAITINGHTYYPKSEIEAARRAAFEEAAFACASGFPWAKNADQAEAINKCINAIRAASVPELTIPNPSEDH